MSGISSSPPPSAASGGSAAPQAATASAAQSAPANTTATSTAPPSTGQSVPSGPVTASSASGSAPVVASIADAPAIVATLARGTVLSGNVLTPGQTGNLLVQTQYGTLELDLKLALQAGTRVALQIGDTNQIRLQVAGPVASPLPSSVRPSATLPDAAVRLPNQILAATLQTPGGRISPDGIPSETAPDGIEAGQGRRQWQGEAVDSARLPTVLRNLTSGAQFRLQITGIATDGPMQGSQTRPAVAEQNIIPSARTSGTPSPYPGRGITGTDPVASGTVIAVTVQGHPVIRTPFGIVSLNDPIQLPLGAQLRLQILSTSLPVSRAESGEPDILLPAVRTLSWSGLTELIGPGVKSAVPAALLGHVLNRVPTAGPPLASNLLFLLSALNSGQLGSWLGRPFVEQMQREGHGDLMSRLEQDMTLASRLSDQSGGEWRSLVLPFLDDGQIRQLRLFLRRRRDDTDDDGSDHPEQDATRFLLEIELTRIGELQLDGLIRSKLFDLILRTRQPFAPAMRQEIVRIFTESNQDLGLAGQILFEASEQWQTANAQIHEPDSTSGLTI